MQIDRPYLLFLGDVPDQLAARTAQGIVDWRPDWCVGQLRLDGCKADCGLADLTIAEAKERGAKTMIVGVANAGGILPRHWTREIIAALACGLGVLVRAVSNTGADRPLAVAGCAALAVMALGYFPFETPLLAYPAILFLAWVFARASDPRTKAET